MISPPDVHEHETDRDHGTLTFGSEHAALALAEDDEQRVAAIARRVRAATGERGPQRDDRGRRVPGIAIGDLNIVFGPHGARLEPASDQLITESGAGGIDVGNPPAIDLQSGATRSVWDALATGASVVRVESGPAAGTATLFRFLAAEAAQRGFSDGVLFVSDSRGPAGDVAQRLATQIYPEQPPRLYSRAQLRLLGRGRTFLVLLLRSRLTAADVTDLCGMFPELRFVIDGVIELPQTPTVELGALPANVADRLFDERVRARAGANDRDTVRRLCASVGSLPQSVALAGLAARELPSSYAALVAQGRGNDLVRAFIESRSPVERRILGLLAFARAPLSNCHLCYILGVRSIETELRHLVENELVRVCGPDIYDLSQYVEQLVTPLPDAAQLRVLLGHIFSDVLDRWSQTPVLDRQIAGAETFLERADGDSLDDVVLELGPLLARMYAIRGAFGGWGRVLRTIERAAMRAGDTCALALTRHDLAVRAMLVGQETDARAYAQAAWVSRQRHGDLEGANASNSVRLLLDPPVAREERARVPPLVAQAPPLATQVPPPMVEASPLATQVPPPMVEAPPLVTDVPPLVMEVPPTFDALPHESPLGASSSKWFAHVSGWLNDAPFGHRLPTAAIERVLRALERQFVELPARWVVPAALCVVMGLLIAGGALVASFARPASAPIPEIVNFVANPRTIVAGRGATLCVNARNVAVVEIFPTSTHFAGSGNHCVGVSPQVTTAYVAVGSAADGRQVRAEILVPVQGPAAAAGGAERVSIAEFTALPQRILTGQSTRLCYAVAGAHILRIVPPVGKLVRLRDCRTLTLRAPGQYGFVLSAIGDPGQVAVAHARVDVLTRGATRTRSAR